MTPKITLALNKFENALRNAIRKDTIAEQTEAWEASKLKACEVAWAECKTARVNLESEIESELARAAIRWKPETQTRTCSQCGVRIFSKPDPGLNINPCSFCGEPIEWKPIPKPPPGWKPEWKKG